MHQFLILALFIALFAFDETAQPVFDVHQRTVSFSAVLGFSGIVLLLVSMGLLARLQVSRGMLLAPPGWFYRLMNLSPMIVLLWYLATLSLGWLSMLKSQFPGTWLLPEIVTITLPVLLISGTQAVMIWVRQSTYAVYLKQHPDAAEPPGYEVSIPDGLANYLRHHVAIIAGPMLLVVGWQKLVHAQFAQGAMEPFADYATVISIAGTLGIIVAAPLLIIRIWDTAPLPQGPLHETLQAMCRQYQVKIAQILVWRTRKSMINAAVLGVTGRFRYILLTDELLDKFSPIQVQAVMAHEIAHIRLKHIPWLLAAGFSMLMLGSVAAELLLRFTLPVLVNLTLSWPELHDEIVQFSSHETFQAVLGASFVLILWVPAFGWVSRRFERQADTFAVEHLASQRHVACASTLDSTSHDSTEPQAALSATLIQADDKDVMVDTLSRIAILNAIPSRKPSWRHGSFKWRLDYLNSLEGKPVGAADVHKTIMLIKIAVVLIILAAVLTEISARVYFA